MKKQQIDSMYRRVCFAEQSLASVCIKTSKTIFWLALSIAIRLPDHSLGSNAQKELRRLKSTHVPQKKEKIQVHPMSIMMISKFNSMTCQ